MPGIVQAAGDKVMDRKIPNPMGHSLKGKQTSFINFTNTYIALMLDTLLSNLRVLTQVSNYIS